MNTVYYGVKTKKCDEKSLVDLLRKGFDLLVLLWDEFKYHTNELIILNSIVILSSDVENFWKNIFFQIKQKEAKYYSFMIPIEFFELDYKQFQIELINFVNILPPSAHLSLIIPITRNIAYWEFWNNIKLPNVSVMLYINQKVDVKIISRWMTEPITSIIIPSENFLHDYSLPVLQKNIQEIVTKFINKKPPAIIIASDNHHLSYLKHVKWIISKLKVNLASDILIDPVQPLADDLSLQIYEIFEEDSVKYDQYEKAIFMALKDIDLLCIRILVIGPGRGPIIDKLLRAIQEFKYVFVIDCVEKNPKCYNILQEKNINEWQGKVNLIKQDVRNLRHMKYNLIISELLGSFGCNEVCPEILQKFTDQDTIMIPQSYENYLQPIYAPLLSNLTQEQLERPYLAQLSAFYTMGSRKPIWKFSHPSTEITSRLQSVEFQIPDNGKINAFQGTFIAKLYDTVQIGIHPQLIEGFCTSWYPFLFPISEVSCKTGAIIKLQIQRLVNNNVWYEWSINNKVYNKSGLYYSIGL